MTAQTEGYAQGWRPARIEAIVDTQAPVRSARRDCRPSGRTDTTGTPYVLASYSFGGNPNLRHAMVVPANPDMSVAVGQRIRINIRHCEAALPAEPTSH